MHKLFTDVFFFCFFWAMFYVMNSFSCIIVLWIIYSSMSGNEMRVGKLLQSQNFTHHFCNLENVGVLIYVRVIDIVMQNCFHVSQMTKQLISNAMQSQVIAQKSHAVSIWRTCKMNICFRRSAASDILIMNFGPPITLCHAVCLKLIVWIGVPQTPIVIKFLVLEWEFTASS